MPHRATFLVVLLAACGPEGVPARPAAETPEVPEVTDVDDGYAIHEWGVLSFGAIADGMVSAGPFVESTGHGGGDGTGVAYKPVLYAHLDGAGPAEFQVAVDAQVIEHWPLTATREAEHWSLTAREGGITWAGVRASAREVCGHSLPAACPPTADGFCESQNGAHYTSSDGACLEIDGQTFDHLLYRAAVPRSALPFDVVREGEALRLHQNADAAGEREAFRIRVDRLARTFEAVRFTLHSGEATLPEPSADGADDVLAQLFAGAGAAGLTNAERTTFTAVWQSPIRGEPEGPDPFAAPARYRLEARARPYSDAVYYWLTAEEAARLLPLRFDPEPSALRRALLVRICLDPDEEILVGAGPRVPELADGVSVTGAVGIAREVAQRIARVHVAEVRQCLATDGLGADGFASAELTLGEDGRVTDVEFGERGENVSTASLECLSTRFYAWRFPNPSPPASRVTLSFRWTF